MAEPALVARSVWKKFRRGMHHNSLRDAVPDLFRRLIHGPSDQLGDDDFWALRDVDFEVAHGEAVGVIGPNGAGKSTLLKVMSRILRPTRGSCEINGRIQALLEVASGFHDDLTGRQNIFLNGAILGVPQREVRQRFDQIVEFSGIEPFIDTQVKRYSSGMKARLGFSVAAHMNPEILIVDEVLSVGDAAFRERCIRHMMKLIQSDVTVLFISHNLEQVSALCDRVVVMNKGTVHFNGPTAEACRKHLELMAECEPAGAGAERPAAIVQAFVTQDGDTPALHVQSHRAISVRLRYSVQQAIPSASVLVRFCTADNRLIAKCDSAGVLPTALGEHQVSLNVRGLPLCQGAYIVIVRLVFGSRPSDVDSRSLPLTVDGHDDASCYVALDHDWHVQGG